MLNQNLELWKLVDKFFEKNSKVEKPQLIIEEEQPSQTFINIVKTDSNFKLNNNGINKIVLLNESHENTKMKKTANG